MEDEEIEEGMLVEEDAAPAQPEKSPYEILRESKSSVEGVVAKMLSIKKEAQPKSELRELVTQMFLNFVTLRQVQKLGLFHGLVIKIRDFSYIAWVAFAGEPFDLARGRPRESGD
jgi:hypothetical protein